MTLLLLLSFISVISTQLLSERLELQPAVNQTATDSIIRIAISNDSYFQITTEITLNNEIFNLLVDTGSSQSWIQSVDCETCNLDSYKVSLSSKETLLPKYGVIDYAFGQVSGFYFPLKTSLQERTKGELDIGQQNYLIVENARGLEQFNWDGILGLSFNNGENSIIDYLFDSKLINRRIFFIQMHNTFGVKENSLVIGSEKTWPIKQKDEKIVLECLNDKKLWSFKAEKLSYNDSTLDLTDYEVSVDSGTTGIVVPENVLADLLSDFKKRNVPCEYKDSLVQCQLFRFFTGTRLIKLYLSINKKEIMEIRVDQFTSNKRIGLFMDIVNFNISATKEKKIVLGLSMMRNYHILFDYDKRSMTVSPYNILARLRMKEAKMEVLIMKCVFSLLLAIILYHLFTITYKSIYEIDTLNFFEADLFG